MFKYLLYFFNFRLTRVFPFNIEWFLFDFFEFWALFSLISPNFYQLCLNIYFIYFNFRLTRVFPLNIEWFFFNFLEFWALFSEISPVFYQLCLLYFFNFRLTRVFPFDIEWFLFDLLEFWALFSEISPVFLPFVINYLLSFFNFRLTRTLANDANHETLIKQMYLAFVRNSRFTSPTTWPVINFMRRWDYIIRMIF